MIKKKEAGMLSDIEVVDWDIHHGNGTQIEKLEDFGQKKLHDNFSCNCK